MALDGTNLLASMPLLAELFNITSVTSLFVAYKSSAPKNVWKTVVGPIPNMRALTFMADAVVPFVELFEEDVPAQSAASHSPPLFPALSSIEIGDFDWDRRNRRKDRNMVSRLVNVLKRWPVSYPLRELRIRTTHNFTEQHIDFIRKNVPRLTALWEEPQFLLHRPMDALVKGNSPADFKPAFPPEF